MNNEVREIKREEDDVKAIQYEKENESIPLAKQRYDICKSCSSFATFRFCSECGCFMPLKVRVESASCPLHKW